LEDTPDGGRGILLVRHMAGPLHYERAGGRNIVTLRLGSGG
jgi:anti-sigma regulatory factor (Ser/Thr protein kinase)